MKYYRVLQDNFLWDKGAIISTVEENRKEESENEYRAINEIYDRLENMTEYISSKIVEDKRNSAFFERVYPVNTLTKTVYKIKSEAVELLKKEYKK